MKGIALALVLGLVLLAMSLLRADVALPTWLVQVDLRLLPIGALAVGALLSAPLVSLIGRSSGWRRLATLYPDQNVGQGRAFRSGQVIMHGSVYKTSVRFSADTAHLHFAQSWVARAGHEPFSVPWSDVSAQRDEWPWFPMRGHPMVRLTLAAEPDLRILVTVRDGERIAAESGGRLTIAERTHPTTMNLSLRTRSP